MNPHYEMPSHHPESNRSRAPSVLAALATLILGFGLGAGTTLAFREDPVAPAPQVADLSEAELEAIWKPKVAEATAEVEQVHARVATLEADVADREEKIQALEAQMAKNKAGGASLRRQLDEARAELVEVKAQLAQALADKERLTGELQESRVALAQQQERTREAVNDGIERRWETFLAQARLDVCEKGGRNKMGKCREEVLASLDASVKDRFVHCVRAGQEAPTLREIAKDQETLPQHARWLGQDDRTTKDWYVQLCDPTLPEATGFAAAGGDGLTTAGM